MSHPPEGKLERTLGLFSLIAYGVGDILGAGIYGLVGKIAGVAGNACWLSFLISLMVASLTGLSYAELASRFPRAGGETTYSFEAFRLPLLSHALGFLVLMSGVVSMAAVSHAFGGYVRALFPAVPLKVIVLVFFFVLAAISFRGMRESSLTNVICTIVELTGLAIVIVAGLAHFGKVNYLEFPPQAELTGRWAAVFQGGVLAFYAFIGFEDMVKASEEAHNPSRVIPRAILISLAIVGFFYVMTALAAVSVVPASELAAAEAPLMLVVERGLPQIPRGLFTLIALFAVTNTALVNFVMGARLLYGMAEEGLVPRILGKIHPVRRTPHVAIAAVFFLAVGLALTGTLSRLAQSTAALLLIVFFVVNLSLLSVKRKAAAPPGFSVPLAVPLLGAATTVLLACYVSRRALVTVAILAVAAVATFFTARLLEKN
ncbi:MAG: amino acid permease [Candidatus Omnitrophica bacterium]|nr:amino acid permease [Candidatus Omnitrophota bacterium]